MNYFDFENGIDYYQARKALIDNKQLMVCSLCYFKYAENKLKFISI